MIMQVLRHKVASLMLLAVTVVMLSGCGIDYAKEVKRHHAAAVKQVELLKEHLDSGLIRNATIVKSYANKLSSLDSSMTPIADAMARDATSRGTPFQSFVSRLKKINMAPTDQATYLPIKEELDSLYAGADTAVFNDSMLDLINTLADLSQGKIARVNIPKSASSTKEVAGSYLVGNPQYGQYRPDSSGNSFWEWYGKYSMFSNVVGGFNRGPIYYDSWYSRPRYSYYHDYGRSTYGSNSSRRSWETGSSKLRSKGVTVAKPKKSYGSLAGQRKVSTYSRGSTYKSSAKQYGAKSKSSSGSGKNYSSGSRSSSYSGYKSSSRGTSYGSRSTRSGK